MRDARAFLRQLFDTAVATALPEHCLSRWLPERPGGRVVVVGAGKAAAGMAAELERHWADLEGQVIVPYGHAVRCQRIDVVEAAHPIPDSAAERAAQDTIARVSGLTADDTVVALFSGGGSSLLTLPADGLSLAEKQRITQQLLQSGAAIHEINCVRKKISAIKGGRLAVAAAPAAVLTLVISDVSGNNPALVASGPTLADHSAPSDAVAILERFGIDVSDETLRQIADTQTVAVDAEDVRVLATSDDALIAASALAMEHDIAALLARRPDGRCAHTRRATRRARQTDSQRPGTACTTLRGAFRWRNNGAGSR